MQWQISLDLASIDEWGLNVQQGVVFAYIYTCPSWCQRAKDDPEFFNISTGKMASELSMVSAKRDTMLRHVLNLVDKGLLERRTIGRNQYLRLTDKAKTWNRRRDKNPALDNTREENPVTREENPGRRDKNPAATGKISIESVIPTSVNQSVNQSVKDLPSADPPNKPKTEGKSTAVWIAYRDAYRERYGVEPLRGQTVNSQLCKLVDLMGADAAVQVAKFFLSHNLKWYVQTMHPVGALLKDANKLHTEWQTNRRVTQTEAGQADKTQANVGVMQTVIEKRKAEGKM